MTYKHALADPNEFLRRRRFYLSASSQKTDIYRVYDLAEGQDLPQLDLARSIAAEIIQDPPDEEDPKYFKRYFTTKVVSQLPRTVRYDDVFWCCLLRILDDASVPECTIGGKLHDLIYEIHDDFDPKDIQ